MLRYVCVCLYNVRVWCLHYIILVSASRLFTHVPLSFIIADSSKPSSNTLQSVDFPLQKCVSLDHHSGVCVCVCVHMCTTGLIVSCLIISLTIFCNIEYVLCMTIVFVQEIDCYRRHETLSS